MLNRVSPALGSELSGFSPKYATRGSTTYNTWVRTDLLFDIRILKAIGYEKTSYINGNLN